MRRFYSSLFSAAVINSLNITPNAEHSRAMKSQVGLALPFSMLQII